MLQWVLVLTRAQQYHAECLEHYLGHNNKEIRWKMELKLLLLLFLPWFKNQSQVKSLTVNKNRVSKNRCDLRKKLQLQSQMLNVNGPLSHEHFKLRVLNNLEHFSFGMWCDCN